MRAFWPVLLVALALGCADNTHEEKPIVIETPDGAFQAQKRTVDAVPQKITVVTGDKLKRLQSLTSQGSDFVAAYLPNIPNPDLKDYDHAFHAWQIAETPRHTQEQVVESIGGYLGNRLVADFDMEWVLVTDKDGTDYAVRGKSVEVMAFPFSTVLKRIEDNKHDFLVGVYHIVKQMQNSGDYKSRTPKTPTP